MLDTRLKRRAAGGFLVLAATLITGMAARRAQKAAVESAPAFRTKGSPDAKITIAEFSDFQCPACRAAEEPLHGVLALYGADVRFLFKHFPLERNHRWAKIAAVAAECAGRQGKFWEYHDFLYQRQEEWSGEHVSDAEPFLRRYADEAKLDPAAWAACRQNSAVAAAIEADAQEGRDRWVGATPTFFINGKRFVGGGQLSSSGTIWLDKLRKK